METGDKIRKSLHMMLTQAEVDFEMWQAMRKARFDQEFLFVINRRYERFYTAAENALLNSLISNLYKAFEKRNDTANFSRLLKRFLSQATPELKLQLTELCERINTSWIKIRIVRNKIIAHQSLEQSTSEIHEIAGIKVFELEQLVKDAQDLLYLIAKRFQNTHVVFNIKGAQSFENLLNDLRTNNSLNPMPLYDTN